MPTRIPEEETRPASEDVPRRLELQLDWDFSKLHGRWPSGRDNDYIMERLKDVPVDATVAGASGPILEVAAEAILSWAKRDFGSGYYSFLRANDRDANRADPDRSWLDDPIGRGPFGTGVMLGCDETRYEAAWLDAEASASLDVYELSAGVIRKVRAELGMRPWSSRRQGRPVRFIRADLNFVRLPAEHYDVVWSSGCLHHVTNLEALFAEIERALRPGGPASASRSCTWRAPARSSRSRSSSTCRPSSVRRRTSKKW